MPPGGKAPRWIGHATLEPEAKQWNLKAYQIGRGGYWQLADAVVQFMEDLPGLQPWTEEK